MLEIIKNKLIEVYPHLGNGALEECIYAYTYWIFTTIMWISITTIIAGIILTIFNKWLNYKFNNNRAARKFWRAVYKKF